MKDKAEKRSLLEFLNQTTEERTKEILLIVQSIYEQMDKSKGADDISLKILEIFQTNYLFPDSIDELVDIKNSINNIYNDQNLGCVEETYYTDMVINVLNSPLTEQIQQHDLSASKAFHAYLLSNISSRTALSSLQVASKTTALLTTAITNNTLITEETKPFLLLDSEAVSIIDKTNTWLTQYKTYLQTTLGSNYRTERQPIINQFESILSNNTNDNNLIKLHKLNEAFSDPHIGKLLQTDSIGAAFSEIFFKIKKFFNPNNEAPIPKHMTLKTQLQELKKNNLFVNETATEESHKETNDHSRPSSFDTF